ncbi:tetratricopeptide repeat protein [Corynebacterium mayonis]|uniref:tetratricopeptide repeat protein n=1 Tax=Corynebacterium mayonis TaxID=3062461 RepID=UPI00313FEEF1
MSQEFDSRNRDGKSRAHRGGSKRFDGPSRGDSRGDGRGRNSGQRRGGRDDDSRRASGRREDGSFRHSRSNPERKGFREDRMNQRLSEPDLPAEIDVTELDASVLRDLKVLSKDNAQRVAKHMIMAGSLLEDDPQLALRHARAAKNRAGRVGVVRETNGIVAYHAGEWKEALSELRAARRISGGPGLLAVMADAERGLGRPEKALEIGRGPEARELDPESKVELAIVLAGARHDLGQHEAALATLDKLNPSLDSKEPEQARLTYAYADALLALERREEAKTWFEHAAKIDSFHVTDAAHRLDELG